MAVCRDEAGGLTRGAAGDAPRTDCIQADGGEDGSQGCVPDCGADALGLVSASALQIEGSARNTRDANRPKTGQIQAARRGVEPTRHSSRLRAEGWAHHAQSICRARERVSHRSAYATIPSEIAARSACSAAAGAQELRKTCAGYGEVRCAGAHADDQA